MHILGFLYWNFKTISTQSTVLTWLEKEESEERRTITGFEHFSVRYLRLVRYSFLLSLLAPKGALAMSKLLECQKESVLISSSEFVPVC